MSYHYVPSFRRPSGFTLIEFLVATGLFSIITVIAISITVQAIHAKHRNDVIQAVQDNIRFSLELLTKEMRTGIEFQITANCSPVIPPNGTNSITGSEISFRATDLITPYRLYFLTANKIVRLKKATPATSSDCASARDFAADEIRVDSLRFQLQGGDTTLIECDGQPMVTISLNVRPRDPAFSAGTAMQLQTTVVQRLRDVSSGPPPC